MNLEAILSMLKANLEKLNSVNDDYLELLIQVSINEIEHEGVRLHSDDEGYYPLDEANGIVMYAAYLYRKRVSTSDSYQTAMLNPQGMPYMLRLWLNNHIMQQAMEVSE